MPEHINIGDGLTLQPGATVGIDREGKWTATLVYQCATHLLARLMPRPGSRHPSVHFVTLDNATAKEMEGGISEITCNYAGADPDGDGDGEPDDGDGDGDDGDDEDGGGGGGGAPDGSKVKPVYSMTLALSEEPLLAHIRYRDTLSAVEREALRLIQSGKDKDDQGNLLKDKLKSGRAIEAFTKIQRGQTSYYCPRITWRASWVRSSALPAASLNMIGNISAPHGPAPGLGGGRNWLLNGATQTQEGKSVRVEMEWIASDRGGWDPQLYADG